MLMPQALFYPYLSTWNLIIVSNHDLMELFNDDIEYGDI